MIVSEAVGNVIVMASAEDDVKVIVSFAVTSTVGWADRKSTRLNSSHVKRSRMPSSA